MPSRLCSQQYPKKLSINAIQPTTNIAQFTHSILYCGANGPIHQNANANLKTLSTLPKFCFIFSPFILFFHEFFITTFAAKIIFLSFLYNAKFSIFLINIHSADWVFCHFSPHFKFQLKSMVVLSFITSLMDFAFLFIGGNFKTPLL